MSLWPISRLLCVCESRITMKISSISTLSGLHVGNQGWWCIELKNHSSLALGFGAATTAGTRDIFLSIWTLWRVIAVISSIHVPRWHRALTSTHLLTIPGFWLSLSYRQEQQTDHASDQPGHRAQNNRQNPLPTSPPSPLYNHLSTKWICTMGCLGWIYDQLGCLIVVKLSGTKWEKSDPLPQT